jgi:hypothetical protein
MGRTLRARYLKAGGNITRQPFIFPLSGIFKVTGGFGVFVQEKSLVSYL